MNASANSISMAQNVKNERLHSVLYRRKRNAAPIYTSISKWLCLARHNQILFHHREYLEKIQAMHDKGMITDADVRRKANELVSKETARMIESEKHLLAPCLDSQDVFNAAAMQFLLWHHRPFKTEHVSGKIHCARKDNQLLIYFDCGMCPDHTVYKYNIIFYTPKHSHTFLYELLKVDFKMIKPNKPINGSSGLRYVGLSHTDRDVLKLTFLNAKIFSCQQQLVFQLSRRIACKRIVRFIQNGGVTKCETSKQDEPEPEINAEKKKKTAMRKKMKRARKREQKAKQHQCAILIQKHVKRKLHQQRYLKWLHSSIIIQKRTRAYLVRIRQHRIKLAQRAAANYRDPLRIVQNLLTNDIQDLVNVIRKRCSMVRDIEAEVFYNLQQKVLEIVPFASLELYGSAATGFALPSSDLDCVLHMENPKHRLLRRAIPSQVSNVGLVTGQPHSQPGWFESMRNYCMGVGVVEPDDPNDLLFWLVKEIKLQPWVKQIRVVGSSRMPVFKLVCTPPNTHISVKVDITLWQPGHTGVLVTKLMKDLQRKHPALQPLTVALKQYLFEERLNNAYHGGISSYSISLLVACFLKSSYARGCNNLGSLFLGMLKLFSEDNFFEVYGVSLQKGFYTLNDLEERQSEMKDPLVIEDPLNTANNVGKLTFRIKEVQQAMRRAVANMTDAEEDMQYFSPLRKILKIKWGQRSREVLQLAMKQDTLE